MPEQPYFHGADCPDDCTHAANRKAHPAECVCMRCKVLSVQVSASAMPTRKAATHDHGKYEATMIKDRDAYLRLRKDGVQPKSTKGAAEVEAKANSKFEVESGQMLGAPGKVGRVMDDTQAAINAGQLA